MGLLGILRGNSDAPKRALVNSWLESLEPPEPESPPPPPLEPPPAPVRALKPQSSPPAMRRFETVVVAQWQDPYTATSGMPPYMAGMPHEPTQYTRVLLPYQEEDSDEEESGDDGAPGQAGMICHVSLILLQD